MDALCSRSSISHSCSILAQHCSQLGWGAHDEHPLSFISAIFASNLALAAASFLPTLPPGSQSQWQSQVRAASRCDSGTLLRGLIIACSHLLAAATALLLFLGVPDRSFFLSHREPFLCQGATTAATLSAASLVSSSPTAAVNILFFSSFYR